MGSETLAISNNVVSRKKLIGIANFVKLNSEAVTLSKGTEILSTEQEVRDTKKAQVLLPLLTDTMDVRDVLQQAKAGGVQLTEAELNEFIVELANEKITKPMIWRPRDGETISANQLFDRYKSSYQISAIVSKDKAYYETTYNQAIAGVPVAKGIAAATKLLKAKVVQRVATTPAANETAATIKSDAAIFANQIRMERANLKQVVDKLTQQTFKNSDFCIVTNAIDEVYLINDVRYNMYTEKVQTENGILVGNFDGSPVLITKRDVANVSTRIQLFGAATSVFMLRSKMNVDKVVGVEAYAASLEFDEGTGVWLPHMITFILRNTDANNGGVAVQDRVTFDNLILAMNQSVTTSGNANNSDGLNDPANPSPPAGDSQTKTGNTGTYDPNTFKDDVMKLSGTQRSELKTLLGLPANGSNADLQKAIDAR